jgi:formiminoglutamase
MNNELRKSTSWKGRIDGTSDTDLRWHQVVDYATLQTLKKCSNTWIILGYAGDEGVRRNGGRIGARHGPDSIRKSVSNLSVPHPGFAITDLGDLVGSDRLESDQLELSEVIRDIHLSGNKSVILGGGHELAYAHFIGLQKAYPAKKIGIVSVDAHFDNRELMTHVGNTSGTSFYQIKNEYPDTGILVIGLQPSANTLTLHARAELAGTETITAMEFASNSEQDVLYRIRSFAQHFDILYLTICMDVFSTAYAPGVSAPSACGIIPDARFFSIFHEIHRLNKIHAFDIAEVNPELDQDQRTSALAAQLVYHWMS